MLILASAGAILLEQRPAPGIWGGLWSLPQYDDDQALAAACANWGQSRAAAQKMAGLMHVFSHFKLHIEPWYLQAGAPIAAERSEEHTSELQSLMRISYAVFCLKKKINKNKHTYQLTLVITTQYTISHTRLISNQENIF